MDVPIDLMVSGKQILADDFSTEVVCMGSGSVLAAILCRDHHRQHLALSPTER